MNSEFRIVNWGLCLVLCGLAWGQPRGSELLGEVSAADLDSPALRMEIVTPETVRQGEEPLGAGERRAVVHSRPVWHVGDDGRLAAIEARVEAAVEGQRSVWRADGNTVRFRVTDEGACVYRAAGHVLRVRPAKETTEATGGGTLREAAQVAPSGTELDGARVVQRGSFAAIRFEHIVEPGQVKEIAWIESAPAGLASARWWLLLYRYDSETLTPVLSGGEVLWQANGVTVLRWPAPVVTDGAGVAIPAQYRLRAASNLVGVILSAPTLAAATYPVALDPTTTTASGAGLANRSIRTSNTLRKWKKAFLKITLPSMAGNVVTAATVDLVRSDTEEDVANINFYARAVADTGAWSEASTHGTLDGLSLGTAVLTGQTITTGTGTKTYNIFGDSSKGVSKFYTDYPSGGDITVALEWTAWSGTLNTVATLLALAEEIDSPYCTFSPRTHGTFYPRVNITYTAGSTNLGSFFSFF